MSFPKRTNPAYYHLACRKAILREQIQFLLMNFVGVGGEDPPRTVIAEDVFACDAEVPRDVVFEQVEELRAREAQVQLELNKFDFTRKPDKQATEASPEVGGQVGS